MHTNKRIQNICILTSVSKESDFLAVPLPLSYLKTFLCAPVKPIHDGGHHFNRHCRNVANAIVVLSARLAIVRTCWLSRTTRPQRGTGTYAAAYRTFKLFRLFLCISMPHNLFIYQNQQYTTMLRNVVVAGSWREIKLTPNS